MLDDGKTKRGRGRPSGASRLNAADDELLVQIASIVMMEDVRPTTAMRRLSIRSDTTIRRLQRKWRNGAKRYQQLAEESRSLSADRTEVKVQHPLTAASMNSANSAAIRSLTTWAEMPEVRRAQERAQKLMDSPAMRRARAMMDSPEMRRAQELLNRIANSPEMKRLREQHDRIMKLLDTPEMKDARERAENMLALAQALPVKRFPNY